MLVAFNLDKFVVFTMGRTGKSWQIRKNKCWFKAKNDIRIESLSSQHRKPKIDSASNVKPLKRLTHQEFGRVFKLDSDNVWTSTGSGILDPSKHSSPGVLLRPLANAK